MTDHPGDNIDNRSRAFWAGALAFVGFGIALFLALKAFGPEGSEISAEPPLTGIDRQIIASREASLVEVSAAQGALVPEEKLEDAKSGAIAALAAKKPAKTGEAVPGSAAFLEKAAEAQAAQAPAAGEGGPEKTAPPEEGGDAKPGEKKPPN